MAYRFGESRWFGWCVDCFLDPLSPLQLLSPWLFSVPNSRQGNLLMWSIDWLFKRDKRDHNLSGMVSEQRIHPQKSFCKMEVELKVYYKKYLQRGVIFVGKMGFVPTGPTQVWFPNPV